MTAKSRLLHSLTLFILTAMSSFSLAAMAQLLSKTDPNYCSCLQEWSVLTCHTEQHQPRRPGLDPTGQFPKKQEIFPLFQRLPVTTNSLKAPWLWKVPADRENKKGCWIAPTVHCQLWARRTGDPLPETTTLLWISLELQNAFPSQYHWKPFLTNFSQKLYHEMVHLIPRRWHHMKKLYTNLRWWHIIDM